NASRRPSGLHAGYELAPWFCVMRVMLPPLVSVDTRSAPLPTPTVNTTTSPFGVSQNTGADALNPAGEMAFPSTYTRCPAVPPPTYAILPPGPNTGWLASGAVDTLVSPVPSTLPTKIFVAPSLATESAIFVWSGENASPKIDPGTDTGTDVAALPRTR